MAVTELKQRLKTVDAIRRLGQALWMNIELPLTPSDLLWSKALLGEGGETILWNALTEFGVLGESGTVKPVELTRLLRQIGGSDALESEPVVVWTLPDELQEGGGSSTYVQAAVRVIDTAKTAIWIVSPFLESYGVGHFIDALLAAMRRGVKVTIVAHDIEQLSGASAKALEGLRREAVCREGSLSVYTVDADGRLLVHPKIVLADSSAALLGSANVTRGGMERNLEAGVVLGADAAAEVARRVRKLVASSLVRQVISPA